MKVHQKFSEICSYQGSNFIERFGDMEYVDDSQPLVSKTLKIYMDDKEIFEKLKPEPVTISDIYKCLETMEHMVWALFYCKDIAGVLRAVDVFWRGGGWGVSADSVVSPLGWSGSRQVFSRRFLDTPQTLSSSDSLSLESAIERVKKEGYVIYKKI